MIKTIFLPFLGRANQIVLGGLGTVCGKKMKFWAKYQDKLSNRFSAIKYLGELVSSLHLNCSSRNLNTDMNNGTHPEVSD